MMRTRFLILLVLVFSGSAPFCTAQELPFVRIFDGKTLNGWTTPQPSIWSVEHGTITGRTTNAEQTQHGGWLVWQGGEVGDFELKLKFRILGGPEANSGIQFRSITNSEGNITRGYQADLVRDPQTADLSAGGMGLLYDAGTGRGVLAGRGQKTIIDATGHRETTPFADPGELFKLVEIDGWNEYQVMARGNDLKAIINGHLMSEVIDKDQKHFHASGKIAFQMHHGPPMQVQFKDILLKRYPPAKPAASAVNGSDGPIKVLFR